MEFVAQKLGFLKCSEYNKNQILLGRGQLRSAGDWLGEDVINKKKRISKDDDSSSNGSLSLEKMKITDSSDLDSNDSQHNIAIPIPIRPIQQTRSMVTMSNNFDFNTFLGRFPMSSFEGMPLFNFNSDFPQSQYLSFLVAPYGTPTKFIGPITEQQRRAKVNRYLEKKKTREWKNVKYLVRRELADSRKRVQGRFVKSERKWRWNELALQATQSTIQQTHLNPKAKIAMEQQQLQMARI